MNWGNSIVLVFVAFAAIIITMVTICMKQDDLHLVTQNYYEEEIKYQQHMDKVSNSEGLGHTVLKFDVPSSSLNVNLPKGTKGTVHLFRPSDARLDQKFEVQNHTPSDKNLDLSSLKPGYWRVKVEWADQEKSYFQELKIFI
jgi:hypothetical protein